MKIQDEKPVEEEVNVTSVVFEQNEPPTIEIDDQTREGVSLFDRLCMYVLFTT